MAEYIDREKTLSTLENTAKYYEMPNADKWTKGIHYGLIHGVDNIVDNVPIADVIERSEYIKSQKEVLRLGDLFHKANQNAMEYEGMYRELLSKIDKVRAEILKNIYKYSGSGNEVTQAYCDGFKDSLEIVGRNMGE